MISEMSEVRRLCKEHKALDEILRKRYPFYLFENELDRLKLELAPDLAYSLKSGKAWRGVIVLPEDLAFEAKKRDW